MASIFDRAGTIRRLINQYQGSPNLIALFESLLDEPSLEVRSALESLYGRLDIDGSSGVQLDRIGYIVGQPRPDAFDPLVVGGEDSFAFLGTEPNDPDLGFSGIGREDVGGRFIGLSPNQSMLDPDYRVLLKAVIYRNNSGATIPELERYSELVLGVSANIMNNFTSIDVQFQQRLSASQRRIIERTLLPAAGIRIRFLSFSVGEGPFGFAGRESNTGFGGIGVEQEGSGFVRLF